MRSSGRLDPPVLAGLKVTRTLKLWRGRVPSTSDAQSRWEIEYLLKSPTPARRVEVHCHKGVDFSPKSTRKCLFKHRNLQTFPA